MSVRCKYGIARTELSSLLPLINTMQNKSIENQNYELFIEAIQDVKFNQIGTGISNCSIDNVVMDANLYLTDDERVRFYKMCRQDYETLLDTLNQINENVVAIPTEELRKLRQIYFENEFIGHYRMPTYDMNNEEQNIQQEIIKGIYLIYADFEKEIEKLDIKSKDRVRQQETNNNSNNTANNSVEWLLVESKEEFIQAHKNLFQGKKGKGAYLLAIAMQRKGYLRKEDYGERSDLFRYLKTTFGIEGTGRGFTDAINAYNKNTTHYFSEYLIAETIKQFK